MCDGFDGPWKLYDYQKRNNVNIIAKWTHSLDKVSRVKLNQKLDLLEKNGPDLSPGLLAGPIFDHVYKLKVKGNVQLRPRLCKGPIDNKTEFTLLLGAKEVGDEPIPRDADVRAARNRGEILRDPNRRCEHERIA